MKIDLEKLAREAAAFSGLTPEQAPGLQLMFELVEREAFRDGVLAGRRESTVHDPGKLHETYAAILVIP
jgi:hypothetical protein